MKIPKKLKIGGFIWKVQDSRDIAHESDCFGSTHFRLQKIFLDPDENPQQREQTFIHEIIHILLVNSGFSNRMEKDIPIKEEETAKMLGNGLYQVFKDNNLFK